MHPITDTERAILNVLVSVDFAGVEELRAQVAAIRHVEQNCTCGCPSFTPSIDRDTVPASPFGSILPSELIENEREDGIPRTVIWFADEAGFIANIECVDYDDAVTEWPDLDHCKVATGRMCP